MWVFADLKVGSVCVGLKTRFVSVECFCVKNLGDPIFGIFFPPGDPGCCLRSFQVGRQRHCRHPAYPGGPFPGGDGDACPPPPAVSQSVLLYMCSAPEELCICRSLPVCMLGLWQPVFCLYAGLPSSGFPSIAAEVLLVLGWSQYNYPGTEHGV